MMDEEYLLLGQNHRCENLKSYMMDEFDFYSHLSDITHPLHAAQIDMYRFGFQK
jgi:hypothetical protein